MACRHHERVSGSGYPAGIGGAELDAAACLLALEPAESAQDVFQRPAIREKVEHSDHQATPVPGPDRQQLLGTC
jgi:hypothetical protein